MPPSALYLDSDSDEAIADYLTDIQQVNDAGLLSAARGCYPQRGAAIRSAVSYHTRLRDY